MTTPIQLWLEPGRADPDLGLRARVADPVWFLTRQWQLGEHQGEDASSPVLVELTPQHVPLTYDRAKPRLDPTVVPAEALLEAEPGDWWTIGRRIRLGRMAAPSLPAGNVDAYRFDVLPVPYDEFAGEVDGRAVYESGVLAGNAIWAEVPSPRPDRWSSSEFAYSAEFDAGNVALTATAHRGGDVDWFTIDASDRTAVGAAPAVNDVARKVIPGRLDYPGAPHPRWWQLENRATDIGGFAPDRSHFATMLLLDVVLGHPDDWFSFPVPSPRDETVPSSGVLVQLGPVTVWDSFGEGWKLSSPPADGPDGWSLFHTRGLASSDLVVWPVAAAPHAGPLLDDVLVGVDEDANLAWAVELRAEGLELLETAETEAAIVETTRTGSREFRYLPSTTLPSHWHPYTREHADPTSMGRSGPWRQAVLADLTGPYPTPRPGPRSRLVGGPSGVGLGRGHVVAGHAIASSGMRLQRRARLARDTNGEPVLWVERSVVPLTGPPTSRLRFDMYAEAPQQGGA